MFHVNGTEISLSRGDTGAVRFRANAKRKDTGEDYTFRERDRCVFSIKGGNGQIVKQKSYPMTGNMFTVIFMNVDTDQLVPGGEGHEVHARRNVLHCKADHRDPGRVYAGTLVLRGLQDSGGRGRR